MGEFINFYYHCCYYYHYYYYTTTILVIIIIISLIHDSDNGFDPLGFSDLIPLTYARAAELKHGRVAMLAAFGFIFQQYVHILSSEADPIKAVSALGLGPNLQILSFIGTIELATWKKTYGTGEPGIKIIIFIVIIIIFII